MLGLEKSQIEWSRLFPRTDIVSLEEKRQGREMFLAEKDGNDAAHEF